MPEASTIISLDGNTQLIGVGNISLSKVDDIIYISNTNHILLGMPNSLAVYDDSHSSLKAAGAGLLWDHEAERLTIKNVESTKIQLRSQGKNHNFIEIRTEEWHPGCERLVVSSTPVVGQGSEYSLTVDQQHRLKLFGRLNLKQFNYKIKPTGTLGDQKGDVTIDEDYLYYCRKDFDGTSKIWVRWAVTDKEW